MEFKIISDVENKLFNRREIEGEVISDSAPKREEVIETISKKVKVPDEAIKVKTIQAKFGSRIFVVVANIYNSPEDKNKIERKTKKEKAIEEKRNKAIEEAAVEEKKSEPIPEQQTEENKVIEETKTKEKEEVKEGEKNE